MFKGIGTVVAGRLKPVVARRAVTLVETIVSIALLGVAMSLLAQLVMTGLEMSMMAQMRVSGMLYAQEQMEDILARRDDLPAWEAHLRANFELDEETKLRKFPQKERESYQWTWLISEVPDAEVSDRVGLKEVVVTVHWRLPRRQSITPRYDLRTLLAVPQGASAEETE
jgi:type II secretory pathway pseudopilin PulG